MRARTKVRAGGIGTETYIDVDTGACSDLDHQMRHTHFDFELESLNYI